MKFSLKAVALGALLASAAVAAPIEVEKRDANSDRIAACFLNLLLTGQWPGSCKAAVAVNLGLIKTISINQMSMDFTPSNAWAPTTSSSSVVATMLSIPGITLPIDSVRQHIILVDNGVQLGNIDTPWSAASVKGGTLTTSFSSSALNVFSTSHDAFSKFVGALSTTASHPVTLKGAVDVKLNLGIFGHLTIPGIGFQATTSFQGLNNLQNMKYMFQVNSDYMTVPNSILLSSIIKINNPTNLSLKLGNINLNTATADGYMGNSTITDMTLVPGDNLVASSTWLDTRLTPTQKFLQALSASDQTLLMSGYAQTSTNAALNAGLTNMKSSVVIPAKGTVVSQPPFVNWSLKTTPTTTKDGIAMITGTFQTPYYGFQLQLLHMDTVNSVATVQDTNTPSDSTALFTFMDNLTFNVKGSQTATVTFGVQLSSLSDPNWKPFWVSLINYVKTSGSIPVDLQFLGKMIFNNNGAVQDFDLSNMSLGLGVTNIAVGADFANLLNALPA
ncbi:hypothetical protein EMPS_03339 [Entomortierella parvispora]|uniref:Uncharacterized protein n=1 Tax=Entomortierella parvispora TaxID=205924 RepID=A0A9P3LUJ3_9FUNG|nr:hypothetical protein EMPS_03339 [Entomortierella parvispora]